MERPLEMVVAVAENGVIGQDGDLPWRLPGDLRHFKKLTTGHTLLMGRRTWESLPGKLPNRRHLVLSRRGISEDAELPDGVHHARSLEEALEIFRRAARDDERLFAIGGARIYAQVWDLSSHLHLTRVHAEPPGDTYFPALDLRDWFKQSTERHEAGPTAPGRRGGNDHAFTVEHWTRDPDADADADATEPAPGHEVLRCDEVGWQPLRDLLAEFDLELDVRPPGRPIPATFWGEPEAGLRGDTVYARDDTPLHSLLHEACHAVLAGEERRATLDVDAGGDQPEEDAVCVLQLLLADRLSESARIVSRERVAADMDAWGYSFLAGPAEEFFRRDSAAARELLRERLGPEWESRLRL